MLLEPCIHVVSDSLNKLALMLVHDLLSDRAELANQADLALALLVPLGIGLSWLSAAGLPLRVLLDRRNGVLLLADGRLR